MNNLSSYKTHMLVSIRNAENPETDFRLEEHFDPDDYYDLIVALLEVLDQQSDWMEEAIDLLLNPELVATNQERREKAILSGYTILEEEDTNDVERSESE